MPRKSSIQQLDPRLREAIDALLREGRYTLDDILAHVAQLNAGAAPVSRSALGRYAQKAEAQMQRYREAQEVAKVWVDKLEAEPQGDVARLLPEMLRSVAFQTLGAMSERDDAVDAQEVMLLAKALDHLSKTSKAQLEVELKLRQERERIQKKLADLETEALSGRSMRRLDLETLRVIREDVYGIAA